MKKDFKELITRTTKIGYGIEGFGTFNIHHINNMTDIVSVVSNNEILIKYEHFDPDNKLNLTSLLYGVKTGKKEMYNFSVFNSGKEGINEEINQEITKNDFFNEVDYLYKLIESDPSCLSNIVTVDLYNTYKAFRNFYENTTVDDQVFDWKGEELLDAFNNELWEKRNRINDPVDIELNTFIELDRIYRKYNKKSDHQEPILKVITTKQTK